MCAGSRSMPSCVWCPGVKSGPIVRFATIGTGNFNEDTARLYTDHFLMTCDPDITSEVARVFEFFRDNYKVAEFRHLVVSPFQARGHWKRMIHEEMRNAKLGRPAYIWIKLNNLADPKLIGELYQASRAGVQVRLIVRSMHSLVPGLPGVSDNIQSIGIVGRYLEHSRFLIFCNHSDPKVYIASGDWMPRSLDNRVEVACPVKDRRLVDQLVDYFRMQWDDTANVRIWDAELRNERRAPGGDTTAADSYETIRAYLSRLASEALPRPRPANEVIGPKGLDERFPQRLGKSALGRRPSSIEIRATGGHCAVANTTGLPLTSAP